MAEIVMIAPEQRLEQQLDLDILDIGFGVAFGGPLAHRGIHTRTSDSSLSTSIGLAI
jgi:hypothetical protein